jgi:RHS repeat-associated protein
MPSALAASAQASDPRGNPTAETRPAGQNVTLAYDGYGRLTSYARQGEASLTHSYNGLDDRVATITTPAGGTADTRRFIYAPDGRVLGEYGAGATDVRAEFIWMAPEVGANDNSLFGGDDGLGGYMPLAVATPGGGLGWVHGNHMGVPHVFTDASGAQVAVPASYTLPGFPGQSQTFSDLYYNRYRDYDSSTGRYIQADPIGLAGGASPYSYAMNSPLRYTDPTGEFVPIAAGFLFGAGLEYFTNDCASASDILFAGAIGGATGGGLGAGALKLIGFLKVRKYNKLVKAAQQAYPKKAGRIEKHHITPKYLGGRADGPLAPLDAAYHQQITNAFRGLHGYGRGAVSPRELSEIMRKVYSQFPLPPT